MSSKRILRNTITMGLAAFLIIGWMMSCSESTGPSDSSEVGTLRMILVDAPAQLDNVDSLKVVFEKVLVHRGYEGEDEEEEGWITVLSDTLPREEREFDLLRLVDGVFVTLGEVDLEPGLYTQIRIMLHSATLYVDGEVQDLFIPSGAQTGIKLVNSFTVDPNVITELTVDFDVARSLHEAPPGSGNYILRPTIRLVQTVLSGTISGTVTPTGIGAFVYALDSATADTVTTTMADSLTGHYVLQALLAGAYDVRAEAAGYQDSTRTAVTVNAGENTAGVDFELMPIEE